MKIVIKTIQTIFAMQQFYSEHHILNCVAKRLNSPEHILEGLEKMPEALISLYEGKNTGVLIVKVNGEPI